MAERSSVAAIDLGASSGRVVLGSISSRELQIQTVARFPNNAVRLPDGLHWNLLGLYGHALEGLARAAREAGDLSSVGVDSWAVDYGLLRDGRLLGTPYHYRDEARVAGVERVHSVATFEELYGRNGLQFLAFNTLYQLVTDPLVAEADEMLLVPDLIGRWLTGNSLTERTNASTTGLLDSRTGTWDEDLVTRLGLPTRILTDLVDPGTDLGGLLPHVTGQVGLPHLRLTAVGSHDTASAVVAVPMKPERSAYISCGTWGLVGVELEAPVLDAAAREANFTNERGVDGRIRFLTNVMGLWLLSETQRAWERTGEVISLTGLLEEAKQVSGSVPVIDVQDPRFLPPGDMPARIREWCREHDLAPPRGRAALVRCIVESLAEGFSDAVQAAARLASTPVETIHIVGGGAMNDLLCQSVADRSGRPVLAGPVEATAMGNLLVQARSVGAVSGDLDTLRDLVARTQRLQRFEPAVGLR